MRSLFLHDDLLSIKIACTNIKQLRQLFLKASLLSLSFLILTLIFQLFFFFRGVYPKPVSPVLSSQASWNSCEFWDFHAPAGVLKKLLRDSFLSCSNCYISASQPEVCKPHQCILSFFSFFFASLCRRRRQEQIPSLLEDDGGSREDEVPVSPEGMAGSQTSSSNSVSVLDTDLDEAKSLLLVSAF